MTNMTQKIFPLDLQPRKAIGVNIPFSGPAVFTSNYFTKDAIRNNLINYFLTNRGERYLNPSFGSNIRRLLFENINQDTLDDIKDMVAEDISVFFPRVIPTIFELNTTPDSHTVSFYMQYKISETNIEDELLINLDQ